MAYKPRPHKAKPDPTIEVGLPECGCIVWQEGSVAHLKKGHPEVCGIEKGVLEFIDQGQGQFVLVRHGRDNLDGSSGGS